MAITNSTLAAACSASQQFIVVTASTGAAVGQVWRVDSEFMTQTGEASGTTIPVSRRGVNGSVVAAHAILAPVANGTYADMLASQPAQVVNPGPYKPQIVSYGVNGAIAVPVYDTVVHLEKATAATMTIESPSGFADGLVVTIVSTTAAAHTVDYTVGFNDNTTSSNLATFTATAGNSFTIMAMKGKWRVLAAYGVTIA